MIPILIKIFQSKIKQQSLSINQNTNISDQNKLLYLYSMDPPKAQPRLIFDLVATKDDYIIASVNKGQIYTWDFGKIQSIQQSINTFDNQSVYRSSNNVTISDEIIHAMFLVNDSLLQLVSGENIRFCNPKNLIQKQQNAPSCEFEILNTEIENDFIDYFGASCRYNESKVLIGTAGGKILLFDVYKQKFEGQTSLHLFDQPQSHLQNTKQMSITAINLFDHQLIVGTKTGSVNSIDLRTLKLITKLNIQNYQIPPVKTIINDQNFIYIGHDHLVTKWDRDHQYIGYYETGLQCTSLLKSQDELIVAGNCPNVFRFCANDIVRQWSSSSPCLLNIKKKQDMIFACGTSQYIDVFSGLSRIYTLSALQL